MWIQQSSKEVRQDKHIRIQAETVQSHGKNDAIYLHKDEVQHPMKGTPTMKQLTRYKTGYDGQRSLPAE